MRNYNGMQKKRRPQSQLKINNDILPGKKIYGQGYRDMPKIQSIYKDCREYDGYILEQGTPEEVFDSPKEERTKQFLGGYNNK